MVQCLTLLPDVPMKIVTRDESNGQQLRPPSTVRLLLPRGADREASYFGGCNPGLSHKSSLGLPKEVCRLPTVPPPHVTIRQMPKIQLHPGCKHHSSGTSSIVHGRVKMPCRIEIGTVVGHRARP
jgi:hypothetical protein